MNESTLITTVLTALRATVAVPVTTEGSESGVVLPSLTLEDVSSERQSGHGARTYAGPVLDVDGNEIGREYAQYYECTMSVVARSTDEAERDDLLNDLVVPFLLYEDNPSGLDFDVRRVRVGGQKRSVLTGREPDWFVGSRELRLDYVQTVTEVYDTLLEVDKVVDPTHDSTA